MLHQRLVGLRHHLDQRLARVFGCGRQLRGNRRLAIFALLAARVDECLAGDEVDDAGKGLLLANRQLQRNNRAAAGFAQRLQRALEAGALAVEAVHHDEARQLQLLGGRPHFLGLHHDAGHTVNHHHGSVGHVQGCSGIAQEVPDARSIDDVDLVCVPLGEGEAGRERVLAGDCFFVEVSDRRAVVNLAESVHHARVYEDGGSQLRLARAGVTDECDVAYGAGVVNLHGSLSPRPRVGAV